MPDGSRVQRSTKETDRREALKIANDYERAAADRITETQARRVVQDIYERITERDLPFQTVAEFLDEWFERKKVDLADTSQASYEGVVKEFKDLLGDRQHDQLQYVTRTDVAKYRDSVAARLAVSSVNKKLKILKMAFKAAWEEELIADNPAARVPTIKKNEPFERRGFNMNELKVLFREAHGEWKGMLIFGLYTGQRLGDLAKLTWHNIDMEESVLRFSTKKTGRRQIIPLAQPVIDYLSEIKVGDDPKGDIFPECAAVVREKGRTSMLSAQFYEIMVAAGLAEVRENKQKSKKGRSARRENNELSFHSLRHSATSIMKNAGVSPAVVQEFIGHDSKAVSQNYTHIELDAMRRATNKMPDVFGETGSGEPED